MARKTFRGGLWPVDSPVAKRGAWPLVALVGMVAMLACLLVCGEVPQARADEFADDGMVLTVQDEDGVVVGTWGTCPWKLDSEGNLTVSEGEGADTDKKSPWYEYAGRITSVTFAQGVIAPADCSYLLENFENLVEADLSGLDTSKTTKTAGMFLYCKKLTTIKGISDLNTNLVSDMRLMFYSCSGLRSLDLSGWNTSSAKPDDWQSDIVDMFLYCSSLSEFKVGAAYATKSSVMFPDATSENDRWWSVTDQAWYTKGQIVSGRSGVADTYLNEEPAVTPTFKGLSLHLSDQIGLRFRVSFPANFDSTGCSMHFEASDGRQGDMAFEDAVKDANDAYFTFGVNAIELADAVTATLTYRGGTLNAQYSAIDYITYAQQHEEKYAQVLPLVNALQSYGYYMQGSGWTDGRTHAEIITPGTTPDVETAIYGLAEYVVETSGTGIADTRASLLLNAKTAIVVSVLPEDGVEILSPEPVGTRKLASGTYYDFETRGIGPRALGTPITTTFETTNGQATVTCSPMSYVKALMGTDLSSQQKLAMAAYYEYYMAAMAYEG